MDATSMKRWSKKFRTYWCVVDGRGTAFLVSARIRRAASIAAFVNDAGKTPWAWWYKSGFRCQRVDIKVRTATKSAGPK